MYVFSSFQAEFIPPRASFPSPLSLLYYVAKYVYMLKHNKCTWLGKNPDNGKRGKSVQEQIKYFELLNELIQRRKKIKEKTLGAKH